MEINSLFDVFEHVLNVADGDVFQCLKKHIKMHLNVNRFLQLM